MTWRFLTGAACAAILAVSAANSAAQNAAEPSVRYIPLDAPAGMSQAVIVQGSPLVYTRQLLPLDREGKLVGERSAEKQSEQVLANLDAVLAEVGSGLGKLVRLNVYALSHEAAARVREQLRKRVPADIRPAITTVLTPLPHRKALVAVDAVAVTAGTSRGSESVPASMARCPSVAGEQDCADAFVLKQGKLVYLSGQPDRGGLTTAAVPRSLSTLLKALGQVKLGPKDVVQLKVFLSPASSAEETLREVKKFFPGQLTPPVVFVEWIASAPVEIELIACLPAEAKANGSVRYFNPPDVRPSPDFSRIAVVDADRQIFISGLSSRTGGNGEAQARDIFTQMKKILAETGSDFRHLAKATYYVSDDEASAMLNKVRSEFLDPDRPPAASKVTVHAVGQAGRTMTMDVIAVGASP